jgi:hypothetical protein
MRKSIFLITGAAVALTASPALAQSASGGSISATGSGSIAVAPPTGGFSRSYAIGGNASTGNAQASTVAVPGPGLVQTVTTSSSTVGGSATGAQRVGSGGLSGAVGFGFGGGFGTGSAP